MSEPFVRKTVVQLLRPQPNHSGYAARPQQVPRVKFGNGCLADQFPHEYGCRCEECEAIWNRLVEEDNQRLRKK